MHRLDKKRVVGTAFVLPAFIIHALIVTVPAFSMIYFAMTDWDGLGKPKFVGLKNFGRMLNDYDFGKALVNNLVWMALFLIVPLILGLGLALIFTRMGRAQMVFRTVCFLPYVVSSVIAGKVFSAFYSPYNGLASLFGGHFAPLGDKKLALFAVAFVDNWHWWGFVLVLMMSALHQVDYSLHEAAVIEGANPFQIFFRVTLPQIKASIVSYFVFIIVASFKTFDYVWIMTGGGPAGATELCATWIYKRTFITYEAGYGSALSLAICAVVLAVYLGQEVIMRKLSKKREEAG